MYKKVSLENGLRVVYEEIPYVRSVTIGIWVGTGSRNEDIINNGVSHFIEHMMFKGTNNRSAKEIAESIDNIGGQLNAFTGKECTCYYAKTLDTHIDIAIEVLSDMFFNSRFDKKDIDTERKVILEEIGMYEDSPEELVHDIFSETAWNGNPLGYPILGTQESLDRIDRNVIIDYINKNYIPNNCVISIAGNFNEKELMKLIEKYFGQWKSDNLTSKVTTPILFNCHNNIISKETEQVHLCMGFEAIESGNDSLYTLLAVNNILGGGMSSRLFQKIREEKGLVYSIYSYPASYKNAGLFAIYAGMNPVHIDRVIEMSVDEIKLLKKSGINEDELSKSKEQLKGNFILALESTSSRMNSIGKSELLLGTIDTPEAVLRKFDNINMKHVNEVIERVFNLDKMCFTAVGNIKTDFDVKKVLFK